MGKVGIRSVLIAGVAAAFYAVFFSAIVYYFFGQPIAPFIAIYLIAIIGFLIIFAIGIAVSRKKDEEVDSAKVKAEEVATRTRVLEETSAKMAALLKEAQDSKAEMQRTLNDLQNNKGAMFNLLDDSRAMEESLKREVVERKKAEEELIKAKAGVEAQVEERTRQLREEESRLISSIDSLSLGYIMLDVDGKVFINNAVVERFFKRVDGESIFDAATREMKDVFDFKTNFESILRDRKTIDVSHIPYNGRYFKIYMSPVVFLHDHQGLIGVVVLIEDMTEQELLDQSKSNFIAIASHEMRTPLTIIRGDAELMLQMIERKPENEDVVKFLTAIQSNSVRLLGVLHDFIDVVQQEENRISLKMESFDFTKLVRDVVADLQTVAAKKEIYLKLNEPQVSIPPVSSDVDKSRQILINLIGNAIHYTGKGGVTVELSIVSEEGKKFLKTSVIDTGIGIPEKNRSMLFRKFGTIQTDFLHRTEYGSGLGLYISKLLSTAMGGSVRLENSVPDVGSTFVLLLPIGV